MSLGSLMVMGGIMHKPLANHTTNDPQSVRSQPIPARSVFFAVAHSFITIGFMAKIQFILGNRVS